MSYRSVLVIFAIISLAVALPLFGQTTADIFVTKDGPSTVAAGTDVTYTINVTNSGPDDTASTTTLTDALPAGMTFVSLTPAPGWTCSDPGVGNNGTVSCTTPAMLAGMAATFTLVVHVDPQAGPGTSFTNVASSMNADDPNDENNSGVTSASTPPSPTGDVFVTKLGPDTAGPDTNVVYTITLGNIGPNAATTVMLSDSLPGTMTFVSLSQPAGYNCSTPSAGTNGTITCTIASLASGALDTFTITGHIPPGTPSGTTFSNTATVSAENDPNPDNNTAVTTLTVTASDISVVKSGPGTAVAGTQVTYTIAATNNGPDEVGSLSMSDTLPPNTTFVSITQTSGPTASCSGPPAGNNGTVTCSFDAPQNQTATFSLTVTFGSSLSGSVSNTATVSGSPGDPNTNNNTSTVSTTVTTSADVAISKTAPTTTAPNQDVTYTLTASNNGPSDAQTVSVSDTTPPNTTFVSVTAPAGWSCTAPAVGGTGTVTCSRATLAAGVTESITLVVHTTNAAVGAISNTANISSATTDPNPTNNSTTVTSDSIVAELGITKSAATTVVAGTNLTYTIIVTNNGPNAAVNANFSDALPANTRFASITPAAGFNCTTPAVGANGPVTCTTPSMASGAMATFTLVVSVIPSATGTISNTAIVSSATADNNSVNNTTTANTTVTASADLAVTKTPATAPDNSKVAYTVTVTNNGPSNAASVTLTDATPAGTTFVSNTQNSGPPFNCTNPPAGGTGTITCTIATFAPSATATFTFVFAPTTLGAAPIANTANVASATPDPNAANNSASGSTTPAAAVPASSPFTLTLLALTLAMIAVMILRR